ncbi:histidine-rich glycoprotein-like isoform X1 [Homarus americanus]|nr:histidine-rich glycoprotein-like isoform X1 [Homarus americanus]
MESIKPKDDGSKDQGDDPREKNLLNKDDDKDWKKSDLIPSRFDELPSEGDWVPVAEVIRSHREVTAKLEAEQIKIQPPVQKISKSYDLESPKMLEKEKNKIQKGAVTGESKTNIQTKDENMKPKSSDREKEEADEELDFVTKSMIAWSLKTDFDFGKKRLRDQNDRRASLPAAFSSNMETFTKKTSEKKHSDIVKSSSHARDDPDHHYGNREILSESATIGNHKHTHDSDKRDFSHHEPKARNDDKYEKDPYHGLNLMNDHHHRQNQDYYDSSPFQDQDDTKVSDYGQEQDYRRGSNQDPTSYDHYRDARRRYEYDNRHDPRQKYEYDDRQDPRQGHEYDNRHDPRQKYEYDDRHDPRQGHEYDNRHGPRQRYEYDDRHDPRQGYEYDNRHGPRQKYEYDDRHDPRQGHEYDNRHDPRQRYEYDDRHDPRQGYEYDNRHGPQQKYEYDDRHDPRQKFEDYNSMKGYEDDLHLGYKQGRHHSISPHHGRGAQHTPPIDYKSHKLQARRESNYF